MKFKIGDVVRIIKITNLDDAEGHEDELLGAIGIIEDIDPNYHYQYELCFEDERLNELGLSWWGEEELELIEKTL